MLRLRRITAILLLVPLIIIGCNSNPPISHTRLIPKDNPAPTFVAVPAYTPFVPTPTPVPTPITTCAFLFIACTTSTPIPCEPFYVYDHVVGEGQSWKVVNQEVDQNNSAFPTQVTFTSQTSKRITVSDQLGLTVSLGAKVGLDLIDSIEVSVQASINHTVSQSVTTTIGVSDTFSVPPGKTAYANYGVRVQVSDGHLYDQAGCEGDASDRGTDITYVPISEGWCHWISGETPCPTLN